MIRNALKKIERPTCVRFVEGSNEYGHHIKVTNNQPGCNSNMGYSGLSGQILNLEPACMIEGHILHEFGHALGFEHQHCSPNRDDYIRINWENMDAEHFYAFHKFTDKDVTDFGLGYDYESIMHYGQTAFSNNGKPTMTAIRNGGQNMGKMDKLSATDIAKIRKMYKC